MQKPLRERLTPDIVAKLQSREMSDAEAASMLGVNTNYLNYVFNTVLGLKRKRGKVAEKRQAEALLAESRRQLRIREAKKVCKGTKTLEKAAKAANCSVRTMRRYVDKVAPEIAEEAYE
jgi:AraC-like DNA-binding protein